MDIPKYKDYRCEMKTVPGMYSQYRGYVDVWARICPDDSEREVVFWAAIRELRRTSFSGYDGSMWEMLSFECIGESDD